MRISTVVLIVFAVVSWGVYFRSNTNLTHEETVILKSAAVNDSMIVWTRFNGVLVVDVEGTDLVPNQAPTTMNAWMDAIHRLEARGLHHQRRPKGRLLRIDGHGEGAGSQRVS